VVVILLIVYRSPLLAFIPLLTIALSVWASMMSIALLTKLPGLNFQVINITNVFVIVVLFGAGTDYCLFLIARYREELVKGLVARRRLTRGDQPGRWRPGGQCRDGHTSGLGNALVLLLREDPIHRPGDRAQTWTISPCSPRSTLAHGPAPLAPRRGLLAVHQSAAPHTKGANREQETLEQVPLAGFWMTVADLVVKYHGSDPGALRDRLLTPLAVVGSSDQAQLQPACRISTPIKTASSAPMIVQRYFAVGELSPTTLLIHHPKLDFRSDAGRSQGRRAHESTRAGCTTSPKSARLLSHWGHPRSPTPRRAYSSCYMERAIKPAVDARYVSMNPVSKADLNHITKIDVVFDTDPFSEQALRALETAYTTVRGEIKSGWGH